MKARLNDTFSDMKKLTGFAAPSLQDGAEPGSQSGQPVGTRKALRLTALRAQVCIRLVHCLIETHSSVTWCSALNHSTFAWDGMLKLAEPSLDPASAPSQDSVAVKLRKESIANNGNFQAFLKS